MGKEGKGEGKGEGEGGEGREGKGEGCVMVFGDGRPWSMVFQKLLKILWRSSSVNKQQERTQAHRLESHLGPKSRGGRSGNSPSSFKMEEQ